MQRPQPDEHQSSIEDSDSTDDSAKSIISEISENQDSSDVGDNTEDWVHVDAIPLPQDNSLLNENFLNGN